MLVLVFELNLHSSSAEKMMNRLLISSFSSDLRSQISTREVGRDELLQRMYIITALMPQLKYRLWLGLMLTRLGAGMVTSHHRTDSGAEPVS